MNNQKKLDIFCPHFERCSGCQIDKDISNFPLFSDVSTFFAKHGFPSLQLQVGSPVGWRYRAKLAVRGTSLNPLIGLFEEGTHHVINIPECQVHHPFINESVKMINEWIKKYTIHPYNETLDNGLLRYIQLTVEPNSEKVQLALVFNLEEKANLTSFEEAFKDLWQMKDNFWHSLWINFNKRRDNIIFGEEWKLIYGEPLIWATFCGQSVSYHPGSFFQANPEMFERLLKSLVDSVPRGANIVEFYAGVGAIGLSLAETAGQIKCAEVIASGKDCFEASVLQLPKNLQNKFSYHVGSAKTSLDLLTEDVDTVIVDPPRKGLDNALIKTINQSSKLSKLVYVSCGWNGFVKDFDELISANWQLEKVQAFLFFPGTEHIETLAVFIR